MGALQEPPNRGSARVHGEGARAQDAGARIPPPLRNHHECGSSTVSRKVHSMKTLIFFLAPALAICAEQTPVQRLFDGKLTASERATACFELRGNIEPDVVSAMGRALEDPAVLSCAADNLRIAGAIDTLKQALSNQDGQVRAAAVRQLGTFQKPELLEVISQAAQDVNLLVATNALSGLNEYQDPVVIPYLSNLAKRGGMVGDMALDRLAQLESATALGIARGLLRSEEHTSELQSLRH